MQGREESAVLGEIISVLMNNSMYTYKASGINSVIEKIVIEKLLKLFKFEGGEGIFNPGGSLSNLTAMIVSRNRIFPEVKEKGIFNLNPVIYTSEDSHYSITKNANILGIGRSSVHKIPTNEKGKMRVDLLLKQIKKDRQENKNPFMVVATLGTTVLGSFDNIEEIYKITSKENLWLHLDGSYGLGVAFSKKREYFIEGIENADSLSFNPHKMLGVPQQCSVVLFKDKGILEESLTEDANYLFQINSEYDSGQKSILCGRRNDALKFWSLWKYYGDKGLEERVEKQFKSVEIILELIKGDDDFILEYTPDFLNVCFNYKGVDAKYICKELYKKGLSKVSYGNFRGKDFIRYTCINPEFTEKDHQDFLNRIKIIAKNK